MTQPATPEHQGDLLVVDDDLPGLRTISSLLVEHGYQVRGARNGSNALMMANADPPELILLDIHMPGMDGYQVCAELKNSPATQDVPVLFISAGDDVLEKVKSFELGGVDYINKPYREEEVLARVATHLTLARLHAQLRSANAQLQIEIIEREHAETHLRERVTELSALHNISRTIGSSHTLPKVLEAVSQTTAELFGACLALIALHRNDGNGISAVVGFERRQGAISFTTVAPQQVAKPGDQAAGAPTRVRLLTELDPAALPDPIQDYARVAHVRSALVVPLRSRSIDVGVLVLGREAEHSTFSEFETALAETVAADISASIENDYLAAQARLAAVDAERQRLARELHDSVTQSIYSLILLSSGWERMSRQGTLEDPADAFRRLGDVGQQALREMRLLLHQLRPSLLEEGGLVNALVQRLESVELRANIDARLITNGDLEGLPPAIEDELYNIAQEALNNSLRHARAEHVRVRITQTPDWVTLAVEDDGQGFDPGVRRAGMGLRNIQERVDSVAGTLTLQSQPGDGTRLTISVPVGKAVEQT